MSTWYPVCGHRFESITSEIWNGRDSHSVITLGLILSIFSMDVQVRMYVYICMYVRNVFIYVCAPNVFLVLPVHSSKSWDKRSNSSSVWKLSSLSLITILSIDTTDQYSILSAAGTPHWITQESFNQKEHSKSAVTCHVNRCALCCTVFVNALRYYNPLFSLVLKCFSYLKVILTRNRPQGLTSEIARIKSSECWALSIIRHMY
jgi:hypothetical protein